MTQPCAENRPAIFETWASLIGMSVTQRILGRLTQIKLIKPSLLSNKHISQLWNHQNRTRIGRVMVISILSGMIAAWSGKGLNLTRVMPSYRF